MEILAGYSALDLLLIFSGAFLLGLAKAGLRGIDMLNVTLMALVFGGKHQQGSYYHCYVQQISLQFGIIIVMHNGVISGNWFHGWLWEF